MKLVNALVLAGIVGGVAVTAQAAPLTQSYTEHFDSTKTDWATSLTFQKFDSSLGNLQSVEITSSTGITTTITALNLSNLFYDADSPTAPSSGSVNTNVRVLLSQGLNGLLDYSVPSASFSFTGLQPGTSVTSGVLTGSASGSRIYSDAATLLAFTGPGTITLGANTVTSTTMTYTGGNSLSTQQTYADLDARVTYTYVVPEPATMALGSMAICGLLLRVRRKK